MPRNYTKIEHLSSEIFRRKSAGETNRQIAEAYHLSLEQVKGLIPRQNRKARLVERGYTLRRKGGPLGKTPMNRPLSRMNVSSFVCGARCCKIFYPKLEGGEAQISCH